MLKADPELKTLREAAEGAVTICLMYVLTSVREHKLEKEVQARNNLTMALHAMNSAIIDEVAQRLKT